MVTYSAAHTSCAVSLDYTIWSTQANRPHTFDDSPGRALTPADMVASINSSLITIENNTVITYAALKSDDGLLEQLPGEACLAAGHNFTFVARAWEQTCDCTWMRQWEL